MRITSTHNPLIKFARSLERASVRREEGVYLAEGVRLVTEALRTEQPASTLFYDPDRLTRSSAGSSLLSGLRGWCSDSYEVNDRVLEYISQTESPSGIVAVLRNPSPPPLASQRDAALGLVLDGLADPGNIGTILRTADALGVRFVITTRGTVDLFSPKVVRAGMGAHFRVSMYPHLMWSIVSEMLPDTTFIGTAAHEGEAVEDFSWPQSSALVIGSEASGLSDCGRDAVSFYVRIRIRPEVESLNAAIAAGILMHNCTTYLRRDRDSVTDEHVRRTR